MELKKYQRQVISDLNRYCELVNETASVSKAYNAFWNEKNVNVGFGVLPPYNNVVESTPHVCFKVPTGGGKTFLACNSLRVIFRNMPSKKTKLVVWLVPSEAILTQTIATLSNPFHPYRQKIEAANSPQTAPVQNTMDLSEEEEFLAFDDTVVKSVLESRQESSDAETSAIAEMLSNAAEKSDSYDEAIRASEYEAVGNLPLEVRNKVNVYGMYEQFREDALAIKLPQFFVKAKPSLFTLMEEDCKDLLHPDTLADGFTLTDKSAEIDFQSATENVVEIDVNNNERPKMRLLSDAESEYFKEMMQSLPQESRIRNCKLKIKSMLEKLDFIDSRDLTAYIDRVVDNMDSDTLASLEKNVVGFAERIKKKINSLLEDYKKVQFEKQLATGKIYCLPSFQVKKEIAPLNTFSLLSKSLYTSEGSMNDFERKVIEKVSSLPNVKWWHRNIDRLEFAIDGFINHYPDFIVLT